MPSAELADKANAISKVEADNYINGHPGQFAKRHVFQVDQVSFPEQESPRISRREAASAFRRSDRSGFTGPGVAAELSAQKNVNT